MTPIGRTELTNKPVLYCNSDAGSVQTGPLLAYRLSNNTLTSLLCTDHQIGSIDPNNPLYNCWLPYQAHDHSWACRHAKVCPINLKSCLIRYFHRFGRCAAFFPPSQCVALGSTPELRELSTRVSNQRSQAASANCDGWLGRYAVAGAHRTSRCSPRSLVYRDPSK